MRVAVLYDVHGNLPALAAVLDEVRRAGADRVVFGGDLVPGPMPGEALAALRGCGLPLACLRGNGERIVLATRAGREPEEVPAAQRGPIHWCAGKLSDEEAAELARWPPTLELEIDGLGRVHFCHATPRSDSEIFTRVTPAERVAELLAGVEAGLVVCGHTHMQFERLVAGKRVVNAGSVGMPFGRPGAEWLLLGPGVDLRHTDYDFEGAAARIRSSGSPGSEEFARRSVLEPPGEAEMLALFSRADAS